MLRSPDIGVLYVSSFPGDGPGTDSIYFTLHMVTLARSFVDSFLGDLGPIKHHFDA